VKQYGDLTDVGNLTAISGTFSDQLTVEGTANLNLDGDLATFIRFKKLGVTRWNMWSTSGGEFRIADDVASNPIIVIEQNTNTEGLRFRTDGSVGIAKLGPTRQLDVGGTGNFDGLLEAQAGLEVTGTVSGTGVAVFDGKVTVEDELTITQAGGNKWTLQENTGFLFFNDDVSGSTPFVIESASPSNVLRIDNNGRIGINEPSPLHALDVVGNAARLKNSADTTAIFYIDSGVSAPQNAQVTYRDQGTDKWSWFKGGGNEMALFDHAGAVNAIIVETSASNADSIRVNAGNVGIGVIPTATFKLDVQGSKFRMRNLADANLELHLDSGSTAGQWTPLVFTDRGVIQWELVKDGNNKLLIFDGVTGETTVSITSHADNQSALVIGGGNVGIGAFPGAFKLDVAGANMRLKNSLNSTNRLTIDSGLSSTVNSEIAFFDQGAAKWSWTKDGANNMVLFDFDNAESAIVVTPHADNQNAIRINSGNVGIGIVPGGWKIDVGGSLRTDGDMKIGQANFTNTILSIDAATLALIRLQKAGVTQWRIDNNSGNFRIVDEPSGTAPFVIASGAGNNVFHADINGNVGIGVIPNAVIQLDVRGNAARIKNNVNSTAELIIDAGVSTAQTARISFEDRTVGKWEINGSAGQFGIWDDVNNHTVIDIVPHASNANAIRVNGGNVGIGVSPGAFQLDVSGDARVSGDFQTTGDTGINRAPITNFALAVTGFSSFGGGVEITGLNPLILDKLTTTQRDALTPASAWTIYNTTTNKINFYNGSAWEAITSA
jgi:hypothetical protein